MWIRISSVLLATLVVSGLSLPRPDDSHYSIPEVGTGRRSQYYVLHSDGTFKYGFDGGDGAFESVKSHSVGDRDGKFGYVDPDGNTIRLEYEAGEGGFVARGDHLPKPSPELAEAMAAVVRSNLPFVDPLASRDSDASYGFRFQSEDHSRNEQSDADGTVRGSYSYIDENGVKRSFTYRAGKGIGFVIEGDGLTQDVGVPIPTVKHSGAQITRHSSKFGQSSSRGRHQVSHSHQTTGRRVQTPSRPLGAAYRTSSVSSFSGQDGNIAFTRSQTPGDASYSFSYDAGDHSRSEKSDSDLNVDGSFSFVADDGEKRTLNYVAGSSTGFQADGVHLPKAPVVDTSGFGQRKTSLGHRRTSVTSVQSPPKPSVRTSTSYQRVGDARIQSSVATRTSSPAARVSSQQRTSAQRSSGAAFGGRKRLPFTSQTRSLEEANIQSSFTPQGPYSFSYKTSSHSRSESGDANNNVVGDFTFIADDDGEQRELNYEAGSATGFIAEGTHLPVGPEVPGAPSGQPTGRLVRLRSEPFVDPLADTDTDASYKFEFDSDTYSRSETADEDGNIEGTYTITEEDGTRITYRFKAGKGVGFETEEISRTVGPPPPRPTPYSGPLAGSDSHSAVGQSSGFKHSGRVGQTSGFKHAGHVGQTSGFKHASRAGVSHGSSSGTRTQFTSLRPSRVRTTAHRTKSTEAGSRTTFPSPAFRKTKTHSFTPSSILKSSFKPSHSEDVFPGFTLHSYNASPTAEKFGYVLKFDD